MFNYIYFKIAIFYNGNPADKDIAWNKRGASHLIAHAHPDTIFSNMKRSHVVTLCHVTRDRWYADWPAPTRAAATCRYLLTAVCQPCGQCPVLVVGGFYILATSKVHIRIYTDLWQCAVVVTWFTVLPTGKSGSWYYNLISHSATLSWH